MSLDVALKPIAALAPALRDGKLSPVALAESYLDRLQRIEPRLQSFVYISEKALAQARHSEAEIKAGRWRGHLHGIPVGIKDNYMTEDMPTAAGTSAPGISFPMRDSAAVLAVADDGSGASGAQNAFDLLIFQKKANALIAMETSAARNGGLPIVSRGKVPYIYTSLYEGRSCNRYMYADGAVPEQMVGPIIDHFMQTSGAKKFFLVGSDYNFGRGMLAFTRSYIERKGGTVVGDEYQPMDATDWTAIISKMRAAEPDAVIMSTAGGAPNVTLQKQYKAAGMKALVGNLSLDEGTAKSMGADAEGIFISASYLTNIDSDANRQFLAAMKKKFGGDLKTPNDLSIPEYDAIFLYKEAVERVAFVPACRGRGRRHRHDRRASGHAPPLRPPS